MKSGNNKTRHRRTVPKNDAAAPASAAKTGKSKPRVHRDKPASMDVRGAGAKQPFKARQGILEQIQFERRQACQAQGREETAGPPIPQVWGVPPPCRFLASVTAWQRRRSQ